MVGPMAGARVGRPVLRALELGVEGGPVVPEVVGDPPQVGVSFGVLGLLQRRRPGRHAEHDRPARRVDRLADQLDLFVVIGPGEVVDLDVIDAPGGVEGHHGVVILVRAGAIGFDRVIVAEPAALVTLAGTLVWPI